jgi:alpha-tubulin suppressor-like RCC1 family protein
MKIRRGFAKVVLGLVLAAGTLAPVGLPSAGAAAAPEPEGGTADWRTVSTGGFHTCGIRTTGRLYCWGYDGYGELGDGGTNTNRSTPVQVAGGHTDWTSVSAGGRHTCARRSSGRLYCWGDDDGGQLGDGGGFAQRAVPTLVAGGGTTWTAVSAGTSHTCGRRTNGRLYCWGSDGYGQVGNDAALSNQGLPALVAGGATTWTMVSAGNTHTCGRRNTGRLYCWGEDDAGQIGDGGTAMNRPTPVQVAGNVTTWTTVSVGDDHSCGRRSTGRLYCWGNDNWGELGDGGTATDRFAPVQVAGNATTWTTVNAGDDHVCARRTNSRLYCWGADNYGQLGDNGSLGDRTVPTIVANGFTDWVGVDAGALHTCGRRSSNRVFCWGSNSAGQQGSGTTGVEHRTPAQVDG